MPIISSKGSDSSRSFTATPRLLNFRLSGRPSSSATMAFSTSGMYSTLNTGARALPSHTASARASTPSDVLEDTGMTGTPRMPESASMSILFLFLASSILVRAMMVGRPSSRVSKHRTRLLTRLVASATRTTVSLRPSQRSRRTTFSSSEFPERLYVPGRSCTLTVFPFLVTTPSSNSTVVPG